MTDGLTDGQTEKYVAITHPYYAGKSCSKFGLIPPSGLGGNSVTDGWTDGQTQMDRQRAK